MKKELAAPFLFLGITLSTLDAAPDEIPIHVDDKTAARISEVIKEVESGYGGTLVTSPENPAIDSAAFVERYVEAFKDPTELKSYDYRFERLLARTVHSLTSMLTIFFLMITARWTSRY